MSSYTIYNDFFWYCVWQTFSCVRILSKYFCITKKLWIGLLKGNKMEPFHKKNLTITMNRLKTQHQTCRSENKRTCLHIIDTILFGWSHRSGGHQLILPIERVGLESWLYSTRIAQRSFWFLSLILRCRKAHCICFIKLNCCFHCSATNCQQTT